MLNDELKCQIDGCDEQAVEYTYPIIDENWDAPETAILCDDHAYNAGFCHKCGGFWGGVESFHFHNERLLIGLCYNCREAEKAEMPEFWGIEDEDYYDYYDEDYYDY